jgi:hypothetical protein
MQCQKQQQRKPVKHELLLKCRLSQSLTVCSTHHKHLYNPPCPTQSRSRGTHSVGATNQSIHSPREMLASVTEPLKQILLLHHWQGAGYHRCGTLHPTCVLVIHTGSQKQPLQPVAGDLLTAGIISLRAHWALPKMIIPLLPDTDPAATLKSWPS